MTSPLSEVPASFRRFCRTVDTCHDPVELALSFDRVFNPALDTDAVRDAVAGLGEAFADRVATTFDERARVEALPAFLAREAGFRGRPSDYDDPANSFLHRVVERRRGLPISLSVVYVSVARHVGLPLAGIALPGHFVVGHLGLEPQVFLDPFRGGRLFGRDICDRIVTNVTSGSVTSASPYLAPPSPRTFLTRMLNNLQLSYWHRHQNHPGLLAARMLCVLNPGAADPMKMRGLFYDRLGDASAALSDYEAYLRREPDAPDAEKLRRRIGHLRSSVREGS